MHPLPGSYHYACGKYSVTNISKLFLVTKACCIALSVQWQEDGTERAVACFRRLLSFAVVSSGLSRERGRGGGALISQTVTALQVRLELLLLLVLYSRLLRFYCSWLAFGLLLSSCFRPLLKWWKMFKDSKDLMKSVGKNS
jgi:hypothetical protein